MATIDLVRYCRSVMRKSRCHRLMFLALSASAFFLVFCLVAKQHERESNSIQSEDAKTQKERASDYEQKRIAVRDMYTAGWSVAAADACSHKSGPLLIVMVISAPDHFVERDAIRKSWLTYTAKHNQVAYVFFVGKATNDTTNVNARVLNEATEHKDVVISNVIDIYQSLTLKTISALDWAQTHCSSAEYVLKVDDDVFVQLDRLSHLLKALKSSPVSVVDGDTPIIFGNLAMGWKPVRNPQSKYYISPTQYNETAYPSFVTGPSYVLSRAASRLILAAAWDESYVHLEDVMVTGILAEKVGVPRRPVIEFRNNAVQIPEQFLGCTLLRTISIHKIRPEAFKNLMVMAKNPSCGPQKPPKNLTLVTR